MTDIEHAQNIRGTAEALARAMNDAAETGLSIHVTIQSFGSVTNGHLTRHRDFLAIVNVCRITEV